LVLADFHSLAHSSVPSVARRPVPRADTFIQWVGGTRPAGSIPSFQLFHLSDQCPAVTHHSALSWSGCPTILASKMRVPSLGAVSIGCQQVISSPSSVRAPPGLSPRWQRAWVCWLRVFRVL